MYIYLAHERSDPPEELQHLKSTMIAKKANMLVACDANARHRIWSSSDIIERGEALFDWPFNIGKHTKTI